MSTHKHIDLICIIAALLTLAVTVLFLNGAALGLTPVNNDAAGDGHFTANELRGDWDVSDATRIVLTGDGGKVTGNGAYIYDGDVHIIYAGKYVLSGELADGSVIVEADKDDKVWLMLDGVSLNCDDSAAIHIQQAGKVFLTLAEGTKNTVTSGAEYSEAAVEAGIDGAIYSRDDLTVNGSGSLTVTAAYQHAIVCNDDFVLTGGTLDITAPQDGIHANDSVSIANADVTIHAGDDGITVGNDDETAWFYMESGTLTIPACYEGVEAIDITIAGGTVDITPTDDGINANGRGQNSIIRITGGDITIINPTGRDADGLDSNGSIDISGGNIFISVNTSSCALDCGSENGGTCTISGGTVIAAGGSQMAEGFEEDSQQAFLMHSLSTAQAGTAVTLKSADGNVLLHRTIPCAFSNLVLSAPGLTLGDTVTLTVGETDTQLTVDNSTSGGMGGFGGGKGGMGRGGFDGQMPTPPEGMEEPPQGFNGEMPSGAPDGMMGGGMGGRGGGMGRGGFDGQMPDGEMPAQGGNRFGEGQFDRLGQSGQEEQQEVDEGFQIDATTAMLVAVSALVLLMGLLIAWKFKR